MALEIKIPSPGESITEVELASWFVDDGALVNKNQEVGEIESEKATLPLIAEKAGQIKILVEAGETINVGTVVATIDTSVKVDEAPAKEAEKAPSTPAATISNAKSSTEETLQTASKKSDLYEAVKVTPVAREMMEKEGLSVEKIIEGLKKISASDVKRVMQQTTLAPHITQKQASRDVDRKKVSQLRKKISERLVAVKNDTAMLTTFNEADMSAIMAIRKVHQERFVQAHGIKLGFMSFFTKAICRGLTALPLCQLLSGWR